MPGRPCFTTGFTAGLAVLAFSPGHALASASQGLDAAALGVRQFTPAHVHYQGGGAQSLEVSVIMSGQELDLVLSPHSILSQSFQLIEQGADGVPRAVTYEAPPLYRGHSEAFGGVSVSAALLEDGFHARLLTASGEDYWVHPLPHDSGPAGEHAFFAGSDVVCPKSGLCGLEGDSVAIAPSSGQAGPSGAGTEGLQVAELGCDADFEYYQSYGSSTQQVMNRITSVIDTMNLQYETQTALTHQITAILVRTSASQPYTSSNSSTLLSQFRSEWNANQASIPRDVAQLFTGKNLNGGVIGIAYLGSVCGSFGYSVVESDFSSTFACSTDLSAHELGHNWNASHCSCSSTMNSFITCANSFGTSSINAITNFASSLGCLSSSVCTTPGTSTFYNGSGVNPLCLQSLSTPVIGTNWTIEVDATIVPGAIGTVVLGRGQSSSGTFLGSSEILVNLSSTAYFSSLVNSGGVNVHTWAVPNEPLLVGTTLTIQGSIRPGSGTPTLCNAENALIGCTP
jgi:hypothetical protein